MPNRETYPHEDLTYQINGAAMRVHNRLGPGHKEKVYQRDLTAEIADRGLKVVEEYPLMLIREDGKLLGYLILDHLVEDTVVVEDKALSHLLTKEETAQVINYLAATTLPVGLLLNFGRKKLEFHRILPPEKLAGWENSIIRHLWQPDDPQAAANHFLKRGIEPKQITVPSSSAKPDHPLSTSDPSDHPSSDHPIRRSQSADHPSSDHPLSDNPLRRSPSADHPSDHPLSVNPIQPRRRPQSADHPSAILDQLFTRIQDRKANLPAKSYTTRLFQEGPTEIAKKLGEETIEIIVASAEQDQDQITYESADLIYHLLVLLAEHDIDIADIYTELKKRRK